jgi:hypothetical protein
MADRLFAGRRPPNKEKRATETPGGIGCVVHIKGNGVGLPVHAFEGRRSIVNAEVAPECRVVTHAAL